MGAMKSMQFWRGRYGPEAFASVLDREHEDALGPAKGIMIGVVVSVMLWVSIGWGLWELLG